MDADRFRDLEALFEQAIALSTAERSAFLIDLKATDPELAERLSAMLDADAASSDLFAQVKHQDAGASRSLPNSIGPFRILRKLGEGGMGVVYLGLRKTADFEQKLAIKRLNAAVDSELARQRLLIEQRVLATLRHPNIAQFVDGGEDADGTPYVAMEYIDGLPLLEHVQQNRLSRRQRVALFLHLCQAVHFAHQHLIVHRDIKAGNVLIDAHGVLKLLDFGIAKLLGEQRGGRDETVMTVAGAMTPHYASPEQIRGETVTPLTDIYSLGVVLYEVLAGRRPYDIQTRRPTEIEKIICLTDPEPPLPTPRGRDGDLNRIVAKAMHQDAARRYQSAAQLAEDLQRWLDGRPVLARPDSAGYRVRSFLRRHPFGAAASTSIGLLLIAFGVGMAWQAHRLALERDRAEREARVATETSDFLIELFQASDTRETNPEDLRARDLLDRAAERIQSELESDPLTRAQLMQVIGLAYSHQGMESEAISLLTQALQIRQTQLGPDHALVAYSHNRLGNALRSFGRMREAEPMLMRALAWRQASGEINHDLADSYNNVGLLQNELGWYEAAERSLRQAIELHRRAGGMETIHVAAPLHNLAISLRSQQRFDDARQAALDSLAIKRANDWSLDSLAATLAILANIERQRQDLPAALQASEESLALREQVFGRDSPRIASGLATHANILEQLDQTEEAEALFLEALSVHTSNRSEQSLRAADIRLGYGRFLHRHGRSEESERVLAEALAIAEAQFPEDAPELERYRFPLRPAPD
ncbi:MAG: serine/threonine-protein kinase [Wenzhouxiangella sp.]|nr:serine/threonine-protein kinase [Wenzhouxiangella sp.]